MARSILRDRSSLVVPLFCTAGTLATHGVLAQEEPGALLEITVTGSRRIVRDGIAAPTPVTVDVR